MAANLLDLFTGSLGKDLIGPASKLLGEPESSTKSAVGALMPALLGTLAHKTTTAQGTSDLFRMLTGANIDTGMLGNVAGLLSGGDRTNSLTALGSSLAASLLGGNDKVSSLANALGSSVGIKSSSAMNLLAMILPLLFAFLKKYIGDNKVDANGLASLLRGQRGVLEKASVDPGIMKALGFGSLSSMLAALGSGPPEVERPAAGAAYRAAGPAVATTEPARSGIGKWLPWLIGLLLLGVIWSFFRGSEKPPAPAPEPAVKAPAAPAAPTAPAAPAAPVVVGALPAKIYFETGSAALGAEGSSAIARAAAAAKAGNDKLDLTGYTDKTGDQAANEALAKNRAAAVRDALVAAGVPEASITMKPPVFITGTGSDAEARRVEITKGM